MRKGRQVFWPFYRRENGNTERLPKCQGHAVAQRQASKWSTHVLSSGETSGLELEGSRNQKPRDSFSLHIEKLYDLK